MRFVSLFAGVGGLDLGLGRSGHQAIAFGENWAPACAVLGHHFPSVPNLGDVTSVRELPSDTELLSAGFPCQDLSQAGKTAGIRGERSGLVGHVFRLIDRSRPEWVLIENVSFMLHLDGGRAMKFLVESFEERGYRWAYRVVNSLAFLPQRRERVFFLASLSNDPSSVLLIDEVAPEIPRTTLDSHAHGFYWTEGIRGLGWAADAVPTLKNGSSVGIPGPPAILFPDGTVAKPDVRDAERLQGFEAGWTEPAQRVARASWRWSLVGNAVSVPVAAWIGDRLTSPGEFDPARTAALPASGRWPRAARYDGQARKAVVINEFPRWLARPPLHMFLKYPADLLSSRATAGFLARTERSTLRFVDGFKERLKRHLLRMENLDRATRIAAE